MKVEVLSIGGSLLFKDGKVNVSYVSKLSKLLNSIKDRKFVLVVGGGSIARTYIDALEKFGIKKEALSRFGIGVTRMNARMLANMIGRSANRENFPGSIKDVKNLLMKHRIVCCGGLRYEPDQTSDGTCAKIAKHLKTRFINVTDVQGLYTSNPKISKNAKFIPDISYEDFSKRINKLKYHPGQHFVLDQHAAKTIKDYKVETFIVGPSLANLKKLIAGKKYLGTIIH